MPRRLTFKKADVVFLTSPPKRRRNCKKLCRKALNNWLSLIIKNGLRSVKYGDSVTVNKESLVEVFSSILLLRFSTWSHFIRKKKYIIFIAFSSCEGLVEPAWFFSPPEKELWKKNSFVVNRKFYFILVQWPITYRYHVDLFLKVKNLFTIGE